MGYKLSPAEKRGLFKASEQLEKLKNPNCHIHIFRAYALGISISEISFIFGFSERTIYRRIKKVKNILSENIT